MRLTNRKTGEVDIKTFDSAGDLRALLRTQAECPGHGIYGRLGREVIFYRQSSDTVSVDLAWDIIEARTAHRRSERKFKRPPWAGRELTDHLIRPTTAPINSQEANDASRPHFEPDPDDPDARVLVRKRRGFIEIENHLGSLRLEDVRDRTKEIDTDDPVDISAGRRKVDVSDDHIRTCRDRKNGTVPMPPFDEWAREEVPV